MIEMKILKVRKSNQFVEYESKDRTLKVRLVSVLFVLTLVSVFMLSSCVSYRVNETIDSNGYDKMTMSINLSQMVNYMKMLNSSFAHMNSTSNSNSSGNFTYTYSHSSSGSLSDLSKNFSEACNDFLKNDSIPLINKSCYFDNKSFTITFGGVSKLNNGAFSVIRNGSVVKYVYHLKNIGVIFHRFLNKNLNGKESDYGFSNKKISVAEAQYFKSYVPFDFNVSLPGKIVSHDVGKVVKNTLIGSYYDVLVKLDEDPIVVSEQRKGFDWMSPLGLFFISIAVGVVVLLFVLFRRKSEHVSEVN